MLTTVKGIYENGEIKLEEKPDVKEPIQVIVTFMEEVKAGGKSCYNEPASTKEQ